MGEMERCPSHEEAVFPDGVHWGGLGGWEGGVVGSGWAGTDIRRVCPTLRAFEVRRAGPDKAPCCV